MSALTEMAIARIKSRDDQIGHQVAFIALTESELAAAKEDLTAYRTDIEELSDFLRKQGIDPPPTPNYDKQPPNHMREE